LRTPSGSTQTPDVGAEVLPQADVVPATPTEFASIYEREFAYVWHSLRRLGIPRRELFDVTQNVFLVIYNRLSCYDRERPLRPWVFGITFRVAADYMRLARHAREMVRDELEVTDSQPMADVLIAEKQEQVILREALSALDLERRAVVIAHDFDSVSGTDIAQTLNVPLKTVYYRLRTGREQLVAAVRRIRARKKTHR
jgi:RNA polymerase sigma-70 factor, ECF subfamily